MRLKSCLSATLLAVVGIVLSGYGRNPVPMCVFPVGGGITCRLMYCGSGLWRILSEGTDPKGAVQSFAAYLGESDPCPAQPFDIDQMPDGGFVATGVDGSRVIRSIDGVLKIFSVEREDPVLVVSRISLSGMRTSVQGALNECEQVYGLGERLNVFGKRGRCERLWSTDGYADREATYLPIPFFWTTRGGGFFANTYRRCEADFGAAQDDVWSFQMEERGLDAYFLATASPRDAVCAAVHLQGGSVPPPKWSAGPIICRLGPDFAEWDGPCFSKRCGRQLIGAGVRSVFNGHREIGALPTAVLLEGMGGLLFDRREKIRKRDRERIADACRKLAESGVRAMRYMRVGQVFDAKNTPGFKDEYVVRADVYTNGVLAAFDTDLIPDIPRSGENPDVVGNHPKFVYLDVTNPEAWTWYLQEVWSVLSDCGIRGAKIDFCELLPEDGESYGGMTVRYKWHDPSVFARGAVHHAYAPFFVSRLVRAMRERHPADGFFAFARGGGIGSGRYPGVWAGDQLRTSNVAADQLRAVLNSSVSGIPYQAYDMAGYQYEQQAFTPVGSVDTRTRRIRLGVSPASGEKVLYRREAKTMTVREEADLFLNSLYTAYTTCLQSHGYVRHVYEFDAEAIAAYRRAVVHLKALTPYRERLAKEAVKTGLPPVRPLVLAYPRDTNVFNIDDMFMLGDALMVAPVFNGSPRTVYLPEGRWYDTMCKRELEVGAGGKFLTVAPPRGVVPLYVNLRAKDAQLVMDAVR